MMYYQIFSVKGQGTFPFDMLRYDGCYPSQQSDTIDMVSTLDGTRYVTLKRYITRKDQMPTLERWLSYGWTVEKSSIRTMKL